MPRYKLTIAYDGTDFHGWQRQEPAGLPPLRTVQGVVQEAVSDLLRQKVEVVGASRTDSGVHAIGQVAAFTADVRVPLERLAQAITARLPRDVQVVRAELAHDEFSPIGDARSKCYRYTIEHTSHPHHPRPLFARNLVFATPHTLDLARMQEAAPAVVSACAHTLKGSASGIGAFGVARAAEVVELASADDLRASVGRLGASIGATKAIIAELLRSH